MRRYSSRVLSCLLCAFSAFSSISSRVAVQASSASYGPTTLEQALTRAYNLRVKDGTWARIFGHLAKTGFRADNFCTGSVDGWLVPEAVAGSDLQRVLDAGVFYCGHNVKQNFATPAGDVLLFTGDGPTGGATGAGNDLWEAMLETLSQMYNTQIKLQWKLYNNSQAVLDAVHSGDLDAACAYWQTDGTWLDAKANVSLSRGLAFSNHICPTVIQTEYVWTLKSDNITSWKQLVDKINDGSIKTLCASSTPGSGSETNCRNTLKQYTDMDDVTCYGVNDLSFNLTLVGNCSAVWTGFPRENAGLFVSFPQPAAIARVTFFRSQDLPPPDTERESPLGRYHKRTTLEQAVTRAFNQKVADGTYAKTVDGLTNVEQVAFCTGAFAPWPVPPVADGSDLKVMLDRGTFRCGYPKDRVLATTDGQILLDSTSANVTGRMAEFWDASLIPAVGAMFNKTLKLEWVLHDVEVQTLNELHYGNVDAACAMWNPDGIWVYNEQFVARPLAFSSMYCPSFLQTDNIYAHTSTNFLSFEDLLAAANASNVKSICVADDVTGGSVATCHDTFVEYLGREVTCTGSTASQGQTTTEIAFQRLDDGLCGAVWSGVLSNRTGFRVFPQPTVLVPISLFRTFDMSVATTIAPEDKGTADPAPAPTAPTTGSSSGNNNKPTPTAATTSHAWNTRPGMLCTALSFVSMINWLVAIIL